MNIRPVPVDIDAQFQKALRGAAGGNRRGYVCPLCNAVFHAGPKLWSHAKHAHADTSDVTGFGDEGQAKKNFLLRSQLQADVNKAAPDPLYKPSSHQEHTKANVTMDSDPHRPHSAPGYQVLGLDVNLTGQSPEEARPEGKVTSTSVPRKRGAGLETSSPDLYSENYKLRPAAIKGDHGKIFSANFTLGKHSAMSRQQPAMDCDFKRGDLVSKKHLFNPHTDATPAQAHHKDNEQDYTKPDLQIQEFKDPVSSHRKPVLVNRADVQPVQQPDQNRSLMPYPYHNRDQNSMHPVTPERDRALSSGDTLSVGDLNQDWFEHVPEMLLQPETRPISHEQLVIEVKGIYAGLVMVEAKCIDIDERQSAAAQEKDLSKRVQLKNDQWQSLIALHKQLLHEHHDFFLASQHPSASPALSRLAAKYSMPARMWRHGIHAFLEVLRHRLPESLEHMLAFIYIAYSMMALLYETVSTFEDTWIECLGDLGRYRMAIEDDEPRDRETWSNVARFWYNKASDKSPTVGRLYHHLAILARPYSLEQLSLYLRSLTCVTPFESARGSIMTLFTPMLQGKDAPHRRHSSFETLLIRLHGLLFTNRTGDSNGQFAATMAEIEKDDTIDKHISKFSSRFKETGVYAAVSNTAAFFEYGIPKHGTPKPILRLAYEDADQARDDTSRSASAQPMDPGKFSSLGEGKETFSGPSKSDAETPALLENNSYWNFISQVSRIATSIFGASLKRFKDKNVYALIHIYLVFLWSLIIVRKSCRYFERAVVWRVIERDIPWMTICLFLNELAEEPHAITENVWADEFPRPEQEKGQPLPEDFVLRGQMYTKWYFPETWFTAVTVDEEERTHDPPSMAQRRVERILWLGMRIASARLWIRYDPDTRSFMLTEHTQNILKAQAKSDSAIGDHDSLMSDEEPSSYTPQTTSIPPSDSYDSTTEYTPRTLSVASSQPQDELVEHGRASDPIDLVISEPAPKPDSPQVSEFDQGLEDTPMVDVSPGKEDQLQAYINSSIDLYNMKVSQSSFTRQGVPPLAKLRESEYGSREHGIGGGAEYDNSEDAETYKP